MKLKKERDYLPMSQFTICSSTRNSLLNFLWSNLRGGKGLAMTDEVQYDELYQHLNQIYKDKIMLKEEESKKNVKRLENVIELLAQKMRTEDELFAKVYQRIYYTGSYYEGLRVQRANEFDLNIVLKFPFKLTKKQAAIRRKHLSTTGTSASFCTKPLHTNHAGLPHYQPETNIPFCNPLAEQKNLTEDYGQEATNSPQIYSGMIRKQTTQMKSKIMQHPMATADNGKQKRRRRRKKNPTRTQQIISKGKTIPPSFCKVRLNGKVEDVKADWLKLCLNKGILDEKGYFIPAGIRRWFQSMVDKLRHQINQIADVHEITPSQHGPAETISIVFTDGEIIDVDLVPVMENQWPVWPEGARKPTNIPEEELKWFIVPKEYKGHYKAKEISLLWRIHFPEIEKHMLKKKGCAKRLIKFLKFLRDCQNWSSLASYYLKTVVFLEIHEHPDADYWSERNMAKLFIKMLENLETRVRNDDLPYYFYPSHSLIEGMSAMERDNVADRINNILNDVKRSPENVDKYFP